MELGAVHNRFPNIPESKNVLDNNNDNNNNNKTRWGPKQIEMEREHSKENALHHVASQQSHGRFFIFHSCVRVCVFRSRVIRVVIHTDNKSRFTIVIIIIINTIRCTR